MYTVLAHEQKHVYLGNFSSSRRALFIAFSPHLRDAFLSLQQIQLLRVHIPNGPAEAGLSSDTKYEDNELDDFVICKPKLFSLKMLLHFAAGVAILLSAVESGKCRHYSTDNKMHINS
jgi:hypothetical protein